MSYTIAIGVDPGVSGGIAWIDDDGPHAEKMPSTELDTWSVIQSVGGHESFALIERVHSMPKQGVASTFKFGTNYGILRGQLAAASDVTGLAWDDVSPQKWQKAFGLPSLKDCGGSITKKKNFHKAKAQQLFPSLKITHAIADALLIAEYARRTHGKEG